MDEWRQIYRNNLQSRWVCVKNCVQEKCIYETEFIRLIFMRAETIRNKGVRKYLIFFNEFGYIIYTHILEKISTLARPLSI